MDPRACSRLAPPRGLLLRLRLRAGSGGIGCCWCGRSGEVLIIHPDRILLTQISQGRIEFLLPQFIFDFP